MRHLVVQVSLGQGSKVVEAAYACGAANAYVLIDADAERDMAHVDLPNHAVERFIEHMETLKEARLTFMPVGVLTLEPPHDQVSSALADVTPRSPLEVFLGGLQSVGSWSSFLGYAAAAGIIVWIGLFTNTVYLLIGAMLIAPFAGPAMNAAIATARGDGSLLGRTVLRYAASLVVTVLVAALLSVIFAQQVKTDLMVQVSQLSSVAILLPLVAGAAGALTLIQAERNSLVSGAAVGMLVAASLAPPAGVLGMAVVLHEWDVATSGCLLLVMQLVAINLSGAAVFRWYGLTASGPRYTRGRWWITWVASAASVVAITALLLWQFADQPAYQRSSQAQRVLEHIKQIIDGSGLALLAEGNVRFTRADVKGQHTLLGILYVQRATDELSKETIQHRLAEQIASRLKEEGFNVTPLLDITVLAPPSGVPEPTLRPSPS